MAGEYELCTEFPNIIRCSGRKKHNKECLSGPRSVRSPSRPPIGSHGWCMRKEPACWSLMGSLSYNLMEAGERFIRSGDGFFPGPWSGGAPGGTVQESTGFRNLRENNSGILTSLRTGCYIYLVKQHTVFQSRSARFSPDRCAVGWSTSINTGSAFFDSDL